MTYFDITQNQLIFILRHYMLFSGVLNLFYKKKSVKITFFHLKTFITQFFFNYYRFFFYQSRFFLKKKNSKNCSNIDTTSFTLPSIVSSQQ